MGTNFYDIYCRYLDQITDDLFTELTMEECFEQMESVLMRAITGFKFPKFRPFAYDLEYEALRDEEGNVISKGAFEDELTLEEINIIVDLMIIEWFHRELARADLTRQKYSGPDFKFTSQAAHIQRLNAIIESKIKENKRMQAMYGRRMIDDEGRIKPNYDGLSSSATRFIKKQKGILSALQRGEE